MTLPTTCQSWLGASRPEIGDSQHNNMKPTNKIRRRLEYLRGKLRAENISWSDLAELQSLAPHIQPGDVELLEPAGVPEGEKP